MEVKGDEPNNDGSIAQEVGNLGTKRGDARNASQGDGESLLVYPERENTDFSPAVRPLCCDCAQVLVVFFVPSLTPLKLCWIGMEGYGWGRSICA